MFAVHYDCDRKYFALRLKNDSMVFAAYRRTMVEFKAETGSNILTGRGVSDDSAKNGTGVFRG